MFAKMVCAIEFDLGARHAPDAGVVEIPRILLASGTGASEGERGRLVPAVEREGVPSTLTNSFEGRSSSPKHFQGPSGLSLTTIVMPGVPAHLMRVSFSDAHAPHMKASYLEPGISGGGRSEDDASDTLSSCISCVAPVSSGICSLERSGEDGRSLKLQQDSWNQS